MTLRYAPTSAMRHTETLPCGEVEISIIVRYIRADYQAEKARIRDKALRIMEGLTTCCDRYMDKSD